MVTIIQRMMCQYLNYLKKLNNSKTAKIWKFIVSNTICYSNEISEDYRIGFSIKIHNLHVAHVITTRTGFYIFFEQATILNS